MKDINIHEWQAKYLREDSSRKRTAVEWLVEQLFEVNNPTLGLSEILTQAKEMEKEQIEEAYYDGKDNIPSMTPEEYYNRTYK